MKKQISILTAFLALTTMTIYFNFNASALDDRASQSLDGLIEQLKSVEDYTIQLNGHTDNTGSDNYNKHLSEKRVLAVKNYLMVKGIDSTKINCDSYGELQPIVPNTSESSRALNRRVEVIINGQQRVIAPPQPILIEQQRIDTVVSQKQNSIKISPQKREITKKNRKRLVWTGWKTGFHWNTAGKN